MKNNIVVKIEKNILQDIEIFVDKIIPYLVLLLLFIIITEIFFKEIAYKYHILITILDSIVILTFVVDLFFKYFHLRNFKLFVRKYWLDILVVFPFFLFFRVLEQIIIFLNMSESFKIFQSSIHTALEIRKEIALIADEASQSSRFKYFLQDIFKLWPKFLRLLKIIPYRHEHLGKQVFN